jgi:hypothetical protein
MNVRSRMLPFAIEMVRSTGVRTVPASRRPALGSQTPELTGVLQRLSRARRRLVVVDAVKAILAY